MEWLDCLGLVAGKHCCFSTLSDESCSAIRLMGIIHMRDSFTTNTVTRFQMSMFWMTSCSLTCQSACAYSCLSVKLLGWMEGGRSSPKICAHIHHSSLLPFLAISCHNNHCQRPLYMTMVSVLRWLLCQTHRNQARTKFELKSLVARPGWRMKICWPFHVKGFANSWTLALTSRAKVMQQKSCGSWMMTPMRLGPA